jgi:hypothetical protein
MRTVHFAESGPVSRSTAVTATGIFAAGSISPLSTGVKISVTPKKRPAPEGTVVESGESFSKEIIPSLGLSGIIFLYFLDLK